MTGVRRARGVGTARRAAPSRRAWGRLRAVPKFCPQRQRPRASRGFRWRRRCRWRRRQLQLANGVDEKDREGEGAEEVRDCHCDGNRPPQTVADEVAQAFHELAAHAWRLSWLRDDLGPSDSKHEHRRAYEADGVEQDRVRRGDRADECARQPRPRELRGRAADLELRVAFDEALPLDQRGQVRLVGDVEEHRAHADDESDGIELPDGQRVEGVREWNRPERERAPEIAEDEDRLSPQPVDPDPRGQREEKEGQELDGAEKRDLEGARVEDQDRSKRQAPAVRSASRTG